MKKINASKIVYNGKAGRIYATDKDVYIWDVVIDVGLECEVCIGHMSDIHLNYCNKQDLEEANPVLMSTYENRKWLADGASIPHLHNCLSVIDDVDAVVFNGDTMDYLSHGTMELMQREVWDKLPGVIATVGGHEISVKMQGKVPEMLSREERINIVRDFWKHDMFYVSKVIKEKVMVVGFFNDRGMCNKEQTEKFKADIEKARRNGYVILLFAHEPIRTNNPEEANFTVDMALLKGDVSSFPENFCDGVICNMNALGADGCEESSKEFYNLIIENSDVVKGFFAGHHHNSIYTEIVAKTNDGKESVIPQFIHTASAYANGSLMRILVK